MWYVIGYDGYNKVFMAQRSFDTKEEAQSYADSCSKGWKAFVVKFDN